jgi:hypothetical protein
MRKVQKTESDLLVARKPTVAEMIGMLRSLPDHSATVQIPVHYVSSHGIHDSYREFEKIRIIGDNIYLEPREASWSDSIEYND